MLKKATQSKWGEHLKKLRARVAKVPEKPGIYRWLDSSGTILYVGKAKNLRSRLKSYLPTEASAKAGVQAPEKSLGPWKLALLQAIADVDYTVTSNELEALILETNLIKEHRPKYNVLMKDDKNYVYVRITLQNPYPEVSVTRQMEDDKAKYFGPYLSSRDTHRALDLLHDVFAFHACRRSIDAFNRGKEASLKPCIEHQIGRCNGLCTGSLSKEEYRARIDEVVRFFRSDKSHVIQKLKELMHQAAVDRKFERAGKLRDTLQYFESLEQQQIVSGTSGENTDAIGIALLRGKTQVVILQERDGKVIGERSLMLTGQAENVGAVLAQFLPQYYSDTQDIPDIILIPEECEGQEIVEQWINEQRLPAVAPTGAKAGKTLAGRSSDRSEGWNNQKQVHVHIPERGKKSKLLLMAEENAEEKVQQQLAKWEAESEKLEGALEELRTALKLAAPPKRIECYDISHLGGTETVGSMVVFIDGKARNDHYRSFTLRMIRKGEIDDYKALREVLLRRLRHLTQMEERLREQGLELRKAAKAERPAVQEMLEQQADHFPGNTFSPKDRITLIRKDGGIMGFGILGEVAGGIRQIKAIWIADAFRGRKLGHLLVRKLLKEAKKGKVYVTVHPALEEYYAQMGFRYIEHPPEQIDQKEGSIVMMCEVSKSKPDVSLSTEPDLLVLDGGKGQLSTGVETLKAMNLEIPMISLAKQEEEVFLPGESRSLALPKDSEARFLLMRMRDEAHRAANRHREKRLKNALLPK